MNLSRVFLQVALVVLAFVAGRFLAEQESTPPSPTPVQAQDWTCSMHPQLHLPAPGACPLCGMDLIPSARTAPSAHPGGLPLVLSPGAVALADIGAVEVRALTQPLEQELPLAGRVEIDPTGIQIISPRVSGRLHRLMVGTPWEEVKEGQVVAELYSPMFQQAQQDYLSSRELGKQLPPDTHATTLEAAAARLRVMGMGPAQLQKLESSGQVEEVLELVAPGPGFVMEVMARPGEELEMGMPLLKVVDLSTVQVVLDTRERDLAQVKVGQTVTFYTRAQPGRPYAARIQSIDPALDPMRRVALVRMRVPNPGLSLRPDITVDAVVKVGVTAVAGAVLVPDTAVLMTGRRNLVYVQVEADPPAFMPREVRVGPHIGAEYVVWEGVSPGEKVVHRGAFKIDSEMQLRQLPSLLSEISPPPAPPPTPERPDPSPMQIPPPVKASPAGAKAPSTAALFQAYLAIQGALAADDLSTAKGAAVDLTAALKEMTSPDEGPPPGVDLHQPTEAAVRAGTLLSQAEDLAAARIPFEDLAANLLKLGDTLGTGGLDLQWVYCPMAKGGEGAYWIQGPIPLQNPYFGKVMLRCGEVIRPVGGSHE